MYSRSQKEMDTFFPCFLHHIKFLLRYLQVKTNDTISKLNFFLSFLDKILVVKIFNPEYFCQLFIKFKDQGQFWNLRVIRIPKLIVEFDEDLI